MNLVAVALPVALASANLSGASVDVHRGTATVTRVGQPFCAGRIDLQNYFRATLSGAVESIPPTNEACSLFKHQRHAVVVRALPNLGLVKLKVSVEHGTVTGWTTNAGMDVP